MMDVHSTVFWLCHHTDKRKYDWCVARTRISELSNFELQQSQEYRGAVKPLARPRRKQATATEDFEFHVSYL
jgi:hypothetical protein